MGSSTHSVMVRLTILAAMIAAATAGLVKGNRRYINGLQNEPGCLFNGARFEVTEPNLWVKSSRSFNKNVAKVTLLLDPEAFLATLSAEKQAKIRALPKGWHIRNVP